jgi:hypothetical protein
MYNILEHYEIKTLKIKEAQDISYLIYSLISKDGSTTYLSAIKLRKG